MIAALVLGVLILLAGFGYLIERRGHRPGGRAATSAPIDQTRRACAASYLRDSITTALVHDQHHPGYSGRRR